MKTRVIRLAECEPLLREPIVEQIPPSEIEGEAVRELDNLRYESKKLIPDAEVSEGCIVTLDIESDAPDAQEYARKDLKLNVGLGLFDKGFEASLAGHKAGDVFEAELSRNARTSGRPAKVKVKISDCARVEIPELSDEMVAASPETEARTMEEFLNRQREKYKALYTDWYLEYYAMEFVEKWFEESETFLDEAELDEFAAQWKAREEEANALHGVTAYEEYPGQLDEMYREEALAMLKSFAVRAALTGRAPEDIALDGGDVDAIEEVTGDLTARISELLRPHFSIEWKEDDDHVDTYGQ